MTFRHRHRHRRVVRPSRARVVIGIALVFGIGSVATVGSSAWASWYGSFAVGGTVSSTAATMLPSLAPTTAGTGGEVVVRWVATSFAGAAIKNYVVRRYSGTAVQTITGACSGTVENIGCVELSVPAGTWTYTVTPQLTGTNWTGPESPKSTAVTTTGIAGTNSLWFWVAP